MTEEEEKVDSSDSTFAMMSQINNNGASDTESRFSESDDDDDDDNNLPVVNNVSVANIAIGTKIEIYWPDDNTFYPGVVTAHVVNDILRPRRYTIKYDDNDEETLDLSKERFRIIVNDDNVKVAARSVTPPDDDDNNYNNAKKYQTTPTILTPEVGNNRNCDDDDNTIEKYPVGERIPDAGPPDDFLVNDAGYEILFDNNEYWQFSPNKEKITFYSVSFLTMSCEVEWNNNGYIYNTTFRKVERRKSKKVTKYSASSATDADIMPKKKRRTASNKKFKSIEQEATSSKPTKVLSRRSGTTTKETSSNTKTMTIKRSNNNSRHYITDELKTTREDILSTLPAGMTSMFHDCCFVLWEGVHRPALILSPFDIVGGCTAVKEWASRYRTYERTDKLHLMPHLIYWYEQGWSKSNNFKAFSLIGKDNIYCYEKGVEEGWDVPFSNKLDDPFTHGTLKPFEDDIIEGIKTMKQDVALNKDERGGPMFFPHLREEAMNAYKQRVIALKQNYDCWKESDGHKACMHQATLSNDAQLDNSPLASLELCAGEERLSNALSSVGFTTSTLDNDLKKRSPTSQLDLSQLERMIQDGQIYHHPYLNKMFSVVWGGPECRTWSTASCGSYRNMDFIDGFQNKVLETDAQQARRDIESLVNILAFFQKLNPQLIIIIENPVGYLKHHPVSRLFSTVLGLEELTVSYCRFSTEDNHLPQKDTNLWTNSKMLITQFKDGQFICSKKKVCLGKGINGRHHVQVQELSDKCSAYPKKFCEFIAGLLRAEMAIQGTLKGQG